MPWLIPLILMAASMGANYQGQKKVDKARAGAMRMERERRERLSRESATKAQSTADLLAGVGKDEQTRGAELEQKYVGAQAGREATPASPRSLLDVAGPVKASTVVDPRFESKATARAQNQARTAAHMAAFGDVLAGAQIGAGRNAQDIGEAGQSMQNWSQFVLPAQLASANMAGRNWNTFADVLQLASMLTGTAALTKGAAASSVGSKSAGTAAADAARTGAMNPNPFMYA
jgi:hypothetical protein